MHRNDEFSRNFRHFSSDVPVRQKKCPLLSKILTTRLMPQLRITPFQVKNIAKPWLHCSLASNLSTSSVCISELGTNDRSHIEFG